MLCIIIHFRIVFGYGYYDFNQNKIRIEYGYHFLKTGYGRIVKIHNPIISVRHCQKFITFTLEFKQESESKT